MAIDFGNTDSDAASVPFGRFTGQTLPQGTDAGASPFPAQLPRYIIELMTDHSVGQATNSFYIYRITAVGFGTDSKTQAVLQSFYRKSAA